MIHIYIMQAVSGNVRRFIKDGFDLDLTYITDRMIAMCFPSQAVEATYRNNIGDVAKFLKTRHSDCYMVYNLCSEKSYDTINFDHRVVRFPMDENKCPHFNDLEPFCEALDEWLSASPDNIAAIHGQTGLGRTGLVISVYMLHVGMWERASESLRMFGVARTNNQKV